MFLVKHPNVTSFFVFQLIKLLACEMQIESSIALWEIKSHCEVQLQDMNYLQQELDLLRSYVATYPELKYKVCIRIVISITLICKIMCKL